MIRVVVTGSECTGKTSLARALAEHYGVSWVPEYARIFVQEQGRAPEAGDVEAIARGQMELEGEAAAASPSLLVHDTDLLSTVVYSRHYYGECPAWVEDALRARAADLYILAGIDVPWVEDGEQRDRGDRREELQWLFRRALVERGLTFVEVSGQPEVRLERATFAIDQLVAGAD